MMSAILIVIAMLFFQHAYYRNKNNHAKAESGERVACAKMLLEWHDYQARVCMEEYKKSPIFKRPT